MLNNRRKAQSSIEYLTGNAWLIVIAIIGILALWQMGAFSPPIPKRGMLGFSQLEPTDWVVSTENIAYIRVINDGGAPIDIERGDMALVVYNVNCSSIDTPNTKVTLNPGKSKIFVFECNEDPTISERFSIGEYYEADLTVIYRNLVSNRIHDSVGKVFGPIEGRALFGSVITTLPGVCGEACTQPGLLYTEDCIDPIMDPDELCPYCDAHLQECEPAGDCGKTCTVENPIPDCQIQCLWCNPDSDPDPSKGVCEQGDCGKICNADGDCLEMPETCDKCIDGVCSPVSSCEDPCSPEWGGQMDPYECIVECEYCYDYTYECVPQGDCGSYCTGNEDCPTTCCFCNPGNNICEQGDCGKTCSSQDDCNDGCIHCVGGVCRGCANDPWGSTSSTVSTTSSTTGASSTTNSGHYIIANQVYPQNGSIGIAV